jgi:hypothetical protein
MATAQERLLVDVARHAEAMRIAGVNLCTGRRRKIGPARSEIRGIPRGCGQVDCLVPGTPPV